jgi:catechol 2,3-dioxygenase-like lactoylglutathione lyase family enzyme
MKPNSIYPVIGTDRIAVSRDFYTSHFDFDIVFEADWYVSLKSRSNPAYELALLDYRHSSLPEAYRQPARGVLINFEVTDVDEIYPQLTNNGLPMILELKSEDWGQRHFITRDPNGILIDVIQNIAPTGIYADQYK